jgi:hypothetical protein
MATTSELLTVLLEQFKGWNVEGPRGLRHYLNTAHRMLRQCEAEQMVYIDETTGKLPYLTTTAGVFAYTLPDNCWKLSAVFVEQGVSSQLLDPYGSTDYGFRVSTAGKVEWHTFSDIIYRRVLLVRSWPCTELANARLVFMGDPGDSTAVYNLRYFKRATDIVSDSIQIDIEPPHDEMILLPATCKLIEGIQHGNYLEARKEILTVWKPLYWKEMNSSEQGFDMNTDDRGY